MRLATEEADCAGTGKSWYRRAFTVGVFTTF